MEQSQQKRILVVGGSGFVGRNLKEYLLRFPQCYVVDAPSHAALDAADEESVRACLEATRYDVVLNCVDLATMTPRYLEDRLRMFANLANASHLYGKMIYFGTGAEYARHLPLVKVTEEQVGRAVPKDTYGLCMFEEDLIAEQSDNIYNLKLFGIFGKYEDWRTRFISNAICKVLRGYPVTVRQDRLMDYLHVDDLCKITEWAINQTPRYHTYNATSGNAYLLTQLAQMVINQGNSDVPLFVAKEGKGPEYTSSNCRLCDEFDFQAEPMEQSIAKLFAYYQENLKSIDKESLLYQ